MEKGSLSFAYIIGSTIALHYIYNADCLTVGKEPQFPDQAIGYLDLVSMNNRTKIAFGTQGGA